MKIAITGGYGQLGRALSEAFGAAALSLTRAEADITNMGALQEFMKRTRPQVIINCAAYTAVDDAETHRQECFACNAGGVENLAAVCRDLRIRLVQISTDYVFGGDENRQVPYAESESVSPLSCYGCSKYKGEIYAQSTPDYLIVRTCGLYGPTSNKSFVNAILTNARVRPELSIVSDQRCSPSLATDVALGIKFLIDSRAEGIFHVVNEGSTTWFDFAKVIVAHLGFPVKLRKTSSREYGATATRPKYSVLDTQKYQYAGGPALDECHVALRRFLAQLS